MKLYTAEGKTVTKVGSPALFFTVCILFFLGLCYTDQASCIRGQGVRVALAVEKQSHLDTANRAKQRETIDRGEALALDVKAYNQNMKAYNNLKVHQLSCPLFFPQR